MGVRVCVRVCVGVCGCGCVGVCVSVCVCVCFRKSIGRSWVGTAPFRGNAM